MSRRRSCASESSPSSTRRSTTRSHGSPSAGTTSTPAPPRPRQSPPSASAASSAAISRSRERAGRTVERLAHRFPDARRRDHVRLRDPVVAARIARGRDAVAAGPLSAAPVRREHADLPEARPARRRPAAARAHPRETPRGQQLEPAPAVAPVGERLRRDRADAGPRPRDGRAGVERLRLHGDPELAGRRVAARRSSRSRRDLCTPIAIVPT